MQLIDEIIQEDTNDAYAYIYSNSWQARRGGKRTRKLVEDAVWEINTMDRQRRQSMSKLQLHAHIHSKLQEKNVGNPIIIALLLNVLISIVAKLIVDWWFNRQGR
jgi:hypothetical protein